MSATTLSLVPLETDDAHRHRWIIAITVMLASTLELLDTSIVNVAIPHMMGSLGATLDQIAWVSTGYIVANVIVLPVSGWLSAYFGRRRYFAGSIAIFLVSSVFCGAAHSLGSLVFWRIVQGLGGGALISTSQAILYETFRPDEYAQATAVFGLGVMVGPTLGPTLGGWLTDTFAWPMIFYVNVPFALLALVLTLSYIRDSRWQRRAASVDWAGFALLALGIGTLQTLLERGQSLDWFASREIVAYTVTSAASLALFVVHELHTEHPVLDLRILANRQFAIGAGLGAILGVCLYASLFALPVYLQELLGFTAAQTGFVILPSSLATAFTLMFLARALNRVDGRLVAATGAALFAVAMWTWSHFTLQSGRDDFFWPLILRGISIGLVFVPLTNLALGELPMPKIASATGFFNLMRQLGGSLGIALSAIEVQRFSALGRASLADHVSLGEPATVARLDATTHTLVAGGLPAGMARARAVGLLAAEVGRQATMLSFERVFLLLGLAFLIGVPFILSLRRPAALARGDAH